MIFTTDQSKIQNTVFKSHPDNAITLTRTVSTKNSWCSLSTTTEPGWSYYWAVKDLLQNSFCTTKNKMDCFFNHKKTSLWITSTI